MTHPTDMRESAAETRVSERPRWKQFGLRDAFWLIVVVALALAIWRNQSQPPIPSARSANRISGPLSVSYKVRLDANSTASDVVSNAHAIEMLPDAVIIHETEVSARMFSIDDIMFLRWSVK